MVLRHPHQPLEDYSERRLLHRRREGCLGVRPRQHRLPGDCLVLLLLHQPQEACLVLLLLRRRQEDCSVLPLLLRLPREDYSVPQ